LGSPHDASTAARLARWRSETPGCADRIHLNNAGAALMPRPVFDSIREHLDVELTMGGYEAAEGRAVRVEAAYSALARLIGAAPRNVAVVENATVAVAQVLSAFDLQPGDTIVTSQADYPSNQIMYLSLAQRLGVRILRAEDLPDGGVDPESVRTLLRRHRCRLVSVSWVPTNSGLVQPIDAIAKVCQNADVPFLVDACQAVGQLTVDVTGITCDFLAGTARKFLRGPRGIGFLYVSDRALSRGVHPLYVDMRGAEWITADEFRLAPDAKRFENWEFAYALLLGQGAAAEYALEAGQASLERAQQLASCVRGRLREMDGVRVMDRGERLCAIVTATVAGWEADPLMRRLRRMGINTGASLREDGVIDMDAKGASSVLRISPHYYNSEGEIDALLGALAELRQTPW
jgi:selenocysteine lyase/cysteine desulfurase